VEEAVEAVGMVVVEMVGMVEVVVGMVGMGCCWVSRACNVALVYCYSYQCYL
jgi:hypothetical protein